MEVEIDDELDEVTPHKELLKRRRREAYQQAKAKQRAAREQEKADLKAKKADDKAKRDAELWEALKPASEIPDGPES